MWDHKAAERSWSLFSPHIFHLVNVQEMCQKRREPVGNPARLCNLCWDATHEGWAYLWRARLTGRRWGLCSWKETACVQQSISTSIWQSDKTLQGWRSQYISNPKPFILLNGTEAQVLNDLKVHVNWKDGDRHSCLEAFNTKYTAFIGFYFFLINDSVDSATENHWTHTLSTQSCDP